MAFYLETPTGLIVMGFPDKEIKEKEVKLDDCDAFELTSNHY